MRELLNLVFPGWLGWGRKNGNLSRINIVVRTEDGNYRKDAGPMFRRGLRIYSPSKLIEREIEVLQLLQPSPHFPRVLSRTSRGFVMSSVGEALSKGNLPADWKEQAEDILALMSRHRIIHRDIKPANLAVHNGVLALLDFGWAVFEGEDLRPCPRELAGGVSRELVYDNRRALFHAIEEVLKS